MKNEWTAILLLFVAAIGISVTQKVTTNSWPPFIRQLKDLRSPRNRIENCKRVDITEQLVKAQHPIPFFAVTPRTVQIPFPFVGIAGTLFFGSGDSAPSFATKDRYGFRNWHDEIYDQNDESSLLVIFLGNSEGVGLYHDIPIARWIEVGIQAEYPDAKVLNLAVNGHSVCHSFAAYQYFGRQLKPDFIVGHWGGGEYLYTKYCSPACIERGIFYDPIELADAVAAGSPKTMVSPTKVRNIYLNPPETGSGPFVEFCDFFYNCARGEGAELIVGLQKLDEEVGPYNDQLKGFGEFYDLVKPRLQASAFQNLIFQDWDEIRMVDNIHSSNESARLIGEAYAKVILDKLKQ